MSEPLRIEVSELAGRQIRAADLWWRRNREQAPNAIREELERIGRLLAFHPHLGARATNVKLRDVRRFHIERIHYDRYYRTVGSLPEVVEIVALRGSRRGKGPRIQLPRSHEQPAPNRRRLDSAINLDRALSPDMMSRREHCPRTARTQPQHTR